MKLSKITYKRADKMIFKFYHKFNKIIVSVSISTLFLFFLCTCSDSDIDSDGDGCPDKFDDFPNNSNYTTDSDNDGLADEIDLDDDGDGIIDILDTSVTRKEQCSDRITNNNPIGFRFLNN